MTEENTLREELTQVIKEGEAMIKEPKTILDPLFNPPKFEGIPQTVIPIERYKHRDIKKQLKAYRKLAVKEAEYKIITSPKTSDAKYARMKLSEEIKMGMTYFFLILITWIGGYAALAEVAKNLVSP